MQNILLDKITVKKIKVRFSVEINNIFKTINE